MPLVISTQRFPAYFGGTAMRVFPKSSTNSRHCRLGVASLERRDVPAGLVFANAAIIRVDAGLNATPGADSDVAVNVPGNGGMVKTPAIPPRVVSVLTNGTAVVGAQRSSVTSIVVNFSLPVYPPGPSAFQLRRISNPSGGPQSNLATGGASVNLSATVNSSTQVTLTFLTGGIFVDPGFSGNSLVDGTYQLTIESTSVLSPSGLLDGNGDGVGGDNYLSPGTGTDPNRIFRLFGDYNGSGTTDSIDFGMFLSGFSAGAISGFDFGKQRAGSGSLGVCDDEDLGVRPDLEVGLNGVRRSTHPYRPVIIVSSQSGASPQSQRS